MSEQANDTLGVQREAVKPYSFSRPFWEATREKKLLLQYCKRSGKYQFFPRPVSIFTGRASDLEWREVSGVGAVFAYTIGRRGPPAFRGHEPYIVATVTLDAGVNIVANLVHCDLEQLQVGLKVKPYWAPLPDGTNLLLFQPV